MAYRAAAIELTREWVMAIPGAWVQNAQAKCGLETQVEDESNEERRS